MNKEKIEQLKNTYPALKLTSIYEDPDMGSTEDDFTPTTEQQLRTVEVIGRVLAAEQDGEMDQIRQAMELYNPTHDIKYADTVAFNNGLQSIFERAGNRVRGDIDAILEEEDNKSQQPRSPEERAVLEVYKEVARAGTEAEKATILQKNKGVLEDNVKYANGLASTLSDAGVPDNAMEIVKAEPEATREFSVEEINAELSAKGWPVQWKDLTEDVKVGKSEKPGSKTLVKQWMEGEGLPEYKDVPIPESVKIGQLTNHGRAQNVAEGKDRDETIEALSKRSGTQTPEIERFFAEIREDIPESNKAAWEYLRSPKVTAQVANAHIIAHKAGDGAILEELSEKLTALALDPEHSVEKLSALERGLERDAAPQMKESLKATMDAAVKRAEEGLKKLEDRARVNTIAGKLDTKTQSHAEKLASERDDSVKNHRKERLAGWKGRNQQAREDKEKSSSRSGVDNRSTTKNAFSFWQNKDKTPDATPPSPAGKGKDDPGKGR